VWLLPLLYIGVKIALVGFRAIQRAFHKPI
jgi:uncharacterized membrane protein